MIALLCIVNTNINRETVEFIKRNYSDPSPLSNEIKVLRNEKKKENKENKDRAGNFYFCKMKERGYWVRVKIKT